MEFTRTAWAAFLLLAISPLVSIPTRLGITPVNMLVRDGTQTGLAE